MVNLDQQRAAFAWQRVEHAQEKMREEKYSDYKNLAKGIPAMIINNGLMQTLAFLHSKGKTHHILLLNDLIQWLHQHLASSKDYQDLMKYLFETDSHQFRQATEESMHMLRWLRQFADTGETE
ncbi:MAG: type III-B CRISPR module-associated protein Cmr5 [Mariprofundaceae bacterium]|nr:type III-B CRISPR module-associated protein Cmr5 [Mariprofundaceae bacterium]